MRRRRARSGIGGAPFHRPSSALAGLAFCIALLSAHPAQSMELAVVDGVTVSWDNTLRTSTGLRLQEPDAITLTYPNADDGDRNFKNGLMMNRLDLLSVLDVTAESFGLQLSLAAWYDSVYFSRTGNTAPLTVNTVSVPVSQFTPAAKNLDGQHAEWGESFVYGNFALGGMPVSLRLGRQTLLWGESLFFDQNGIAAGMAPVDYLKKAIAADGYSRNVFLPVNQLSVTAQPSADVSVSAYYQFEWRASRLPAIGSYFSDTDVQGAGAEQAFLTHGQFLTHVANQTPPDGGQFGVSLHKTIGDFDLGLYALRYHSKYPVLEVMATSPAASGFSGTFDSYYPTGIDLYGASFSTYVGDGDIAGEISLRHNMPLVSISPVSLTIPAALTNAGGYARGDTLHGQISAAMTFGPQMLWDSADLSGEIAANDRLAITAGAAAFNPARTRAALSARMLFQPHYFQVLPNLDITPLLGIGINLAGRSSTDYTENAGTSDMEVGVSALYQSVWKVDLTLTSFAGVTYRQTLTDRDFLMLSLERSF